MKFLLNKGSTNNSNNLNNQINQIIELQTISKNNVIIFKKFNELISNKKKEIDNENIQKYWDKMKKIGNPYELIYTIYNKKRKNDSISLYSPISRSYFKLWEIYYSFQLFNNKKNNINFVHLAEGPGGFMEASINYCKLNKIKNCTYWGITLAPTDEFVPDWNKLKKNFTKDKNCFIEYGDLYNYEDVKKFIEKTKKCHIVTADGGFDYSSDFNGQELNSCRIIYSEIVTALNVLNKDGHFIIKLFDLFSLTSLQFLELLNQCFKEVIIYKPETSRPANSEKYLVCTYFLDNLTSQAKNKLLMNIKEWSAIENRKNNDNYIIFKDYKVSNQLFYDLNEFNNKYLNDQIKSINSIIHIIQNKLSKNEYHNTLKEQVLKATQWCKKYNVQINENSIYYKKNN
jgi:23S rRNA U2552 (ribose-2'-O)-methylase RlmE/FtsJ